MKAEVEGTPSSGAATRATDVPELFTASEFAHFCRVDLKTIHNWADKGQIKHFRTPGRHLRFRRLDVIDFLRKYGYPVPEALRTGKPKVVVIDGDPAVLSAIRKGLGRRFEVATFQDPIEALVALGTAEPDVLVIDVDVGGVDAIRCLERIKSIEATAHVRTIVYSIEERRRSALDAGASDFIARGDMTLLREALERATGLERA
jgi:excisionase family DNA binding protein